MYYIRKHSDCWAISDSITHGSRKLTEEEIIRVKNEFAVLQDVHVITIQSERVRSINVENDKYPHYSSTGHSVLSSL